MKFIVNPGYDGETTIEAFQWLESGSFIVFYDGVGNQIHAMRKEQVQEIKQAAA